MSVAPQGTVILNVTVIDVGPGFRQAPLGLVTWSANRPGGSFNTASCFLSAINSSESGCSVTFTAPISSGSLAVRAAYSGDSIHQQSTKAAVLDVT